MGIQSFPIAQINPPTTTPVKGTSLADMMNTASSAQQFQQAQQLNPLALQKAQADLEYSQVQSKKAQATLDPEIEQKKAESAKALVGLNSEQLKNAREHFANSSRNLLELLQKPIVTADDIKNHVMKTMTNAGAPQQAIDLALQNLPTGGTTLENKAFIAKHATNSLSAEAAMDKLLPSATMIAAGGTIIPTVMGNELLTDKAPGTAVGAPITMTPAPLGAGQRETLEEDATGNKVIVSRDANGNVVGSRPVPSTAAQPGFQSVPAGGTKETFQGQAKGAINSYLGAIHAINDVDSPATHLPTQERLAKTILQKLKNPNLDTGPIADVLAKKTTGASLNSEQQELIKLLEQRIQGLAPRTDADAQSKKDAYGSFKLKKDALMDIVRSDLGNIHKDSLLKNGVISSAGADASNPNLAGINNFQQRFSQISQNPLLSSYIGIIGKNKDKTSIDEEDKQALKKFMSENKLSGEQLKSLETERKRLIDLSMGGQ